MYRMSSIFRAQRQRKEKVLTPSVFRSSSLRYGVSCLVNKRYRSSKVEYLQKSIIPTMHFQPSLPRLPIPRLEDTCIRYLDAQKPLLTPEEYEKAKKLTENFIAHEGRALQAELTEEYARNKETSFIADVLHDYFMKSRKSKVLHHNTFVVQNADPHTTDQLVRATKIIHTAVRFKNSLNANLLEPDVYHSNPKKSDTKLFRQLTRLIPSNFSWYGAYLMKALPQDMSQYSRLFNSTRIPLKGKDELRTYKGDNHILILRNGHCFVFDVVRNESLLAKDEIHHNLCQIMKESNEHDQYSPGIFTTENRDLWAVLRKNLESDSKTAESLRKIDGALFVICLDDSEVKDISEASKLFLHGDGKNRWFDKSFSILLTKRGHMAMNFEHSWADGLVTTRFLNEIQKEAMKDNYTPSDVSFSGGVTKLEFNLSDAMKEAVDRSQAKFDETVSSIYLNTFKFQDFGKNYIKKKKLSPDAIIQLAFQMAIYRMSGRTVVTYESCATATFKYGRSTKIRPATLATVACKEAFEKSHAAGVDEMIALLKKSSECHSNLSKDAVMGQGFDRHLWELKHMAQVNGKKIKFFQDTSYRNMMNHIVLSTATYFSPYQQYSGFGAVVPTGLGVCYMVAEDHLAGCVSSYPDSPNGVQFIELVRESLLDIYSVLEGRNFKK